LVYFPNMSKNIIIANWKMNPLSQKEAEKIFTGITKSLSPLKNTAVVICAPFIYLDKLRTLSRKVSLGAQDIFFGDVGAFTGEISGEMAYNLGVRYSIVGHSERRELGENDQLINKKTKAAISAGLRPVVCVGEKHRDAEHGYFSVVKEQLEAALEGVSKNSIEKVIVAYEPVWAISTTADRRDALPEDSHEMAIFIRKVLSDKFGKDAAKVKILYGGSVNDKDAESFLRLGGVDGLLVGRASLSSEKFSKIIKISETLK
jgi:triosephosphate isomerase (TIM)